MGPALALLVRKGGIRVYQPYGRIVDSVQAWKALGAETVRELGLFKEPAARVLVGRAEGFLSECCIGLL